MILWIIGWIVTGILAYPLVRLAVYFLEMDSCVSMDVKPEVWTNYNSVVCIIVCLILGPFMLFGSILASIIYGALYKAECIKKNRKNKKDSWWDRKAKF